MSGHSSNSSPSKTPARYPKRKRASILYTEPADNDDFELETKDSAPNADEESASSDEEAEYGSRKKVKRARTKKKAGTPRSPPRLKPFPFMSLPPELRNKVYELALHDPSGVHIRIHQDAYTRKAVHCSPRCCQPHRGRSPYYQQEWLSEDGAPQPPGTLVSIRPRLVPALLATSKTVYAEAAAMLWSQKFYFADSQTLYTFLRTVRPETVALMQDITIIHWGNVRSNRFVNQPAFDLLIGATNLQRLRIFESITCHPYPMSRVFGAEGDLARAKNVAKKLCIDCHLWLEAMVKSRGREAVRDVLKLSQENYAPFNSHRVAATASAGYVWTDQRAKDADKIMFDEMLNMLTHQR